MPSTSEDEPYSKRAEIKNEKIVDKRVKNVGNNDSKKKGKELSLQHCAMRYEEEILIRHILKEWKNKPKND